MAYSTEAEQLMRFANPSLLRDLPGSDSTSDTLQWIRGEDSVKQFLNRVSVTASLTVTLGSVTPPVDEEWEVIAVWVQDEGGIDVLDNVKFVLAFFDEAPSANSNLTKLLTATAGQVYNIGGNTVLEWRWPQQTANLATEPPTIQQPRLRKTTARNIRAITVGVTTTASVGNRFFTCFIYYRRHKVA